MPQKKKETKTIKKSSKAKSEKDIIANLDKLSESTVLTDVSDMPGLTEILLSFDEIIKWAEEAKNEDIVFIAKKASSFVEDVVLQNVEDNEVAMATAGEAITALLSLIRDKRDIGSLELPPGFKRGGEAKAEEAAKEGFTLSAHVDKEIFKEFISKQKKIDEEISKIMDRIEDGDEDLERDKLQAVFYTLKNDSAMLGLSELEALAHTTQTFVAESELTELLDVMPKVRIWLNNAFSFLDGRGEYPPDVEKILLKMLDPDAEGLEIEVIEGMESVVDVIQAQESEGAASEEQSETGAVNLADIISDEGFEEEEYSLEGDLDLMGDFVLESNEHLDNADVHLLTLETNPQEDEALNAVFRAFHTIKGVAGFLMLDEIGKLAHEAENLLDNARKGDIVLKDLAIDLTFESVDTLKRLVQNLSNSLETGTPMTLDRQCYVLVKKLKAVNSGEVPLDASFEDVGKEDKPVGEILVEEGKLTEEDLENAQKLQEEEPKGKRLGELLTESNETSTLRVEKAAERQSTEPGKKIGEILVEESVVSPDSIERALEKQKQIPQRPKIGEILVKEKSAKAEDVAHALRKQKDPASPQRVIAIKENVKVDADRLDRLLDLIGELVIAESMVTQSQEVQSIVSSDFARQVRHLDKITRELQEMGTSLRMVPVKPIFQKMARLVRDLSRKSGKPVEFHMVGEDTELDKTVVDHIGDPLVHMVRNSVDHGIESNAADREALGKPATGNVTLRSFHKGGSIYIEIEDDGKGLNKDAIFKKAVERGLLKGDELLSDKEIFNLIFEPGFSTAKTVTDVSGRGVGMDVVRKNIEHLRGQVEIRSEEGKGSVFTLRLPLTLAIIDGMVVKVGGERFIIPTLSVVRSIRPTREDVNTVVGKGEILTVQGDLIPLFRLSRLFDTAKSVDDISDAIVMIVEDDNRKTGIVVDELLGQQQIVIKSLGASLKQVRGLSGGAIMPDGEVGLILDVGGLVKLANAGAIDYESL